MTAVTSGASAPDRRPASRRPPIGHVVLVVVGALLLLVGSGIALAGGALTLVHATQRDADGFYTTPSERFESTTYAITSEEIDLGTNGGREDDVLDLGDLATVRIEVEERGEQPVFVGIGPEEEVDRYLEGVEHAQIEDVDLDPFAVSYRIRDGEAEPEPPGDQDFWAASAEGRGSRTIEWELESGQWSVVLMNADGSRGVAVDAALGAKADWILPLGLALGGGGLLVLVLGAVLLVVGAVGLARAGTWEPAPPLAGAAVRVEGHRDPQLSRWLWLVKWLLVIPHLIVLVVLWVAAWLVWLVALVAILVTGRYPRSLFEFTVGVLRWTWRVAFYSFGAFGTDRYPPFTLGHAADYPATLEVAYPATLSRGLVLVKWWLLAIPHYLVLGILGGGLWFAWNDGGALPAGGLLGLLVLIGAVALLFTGRYPPALFDLVVGLDRWIYRVLVYVLLLRDEYPPFRLDQGAEDRTPAGPGPADPAAAGGSERGPAASVEVGSG